MFDAIGHFTSPTGYLPATNPHNNAEVLVAPDSHVARAGVHHRLTGDIYKPSPA